MCSFLICLDKLELCWNPLSQNLQSFKADIFMYNVYKVTDTLEYEEKQHTNLLSLMACVSYMECLASLSIMKTFIVKILIVGSMVSTLYINNQCLFVLYFILLFLHTFIHTCVCSLCIKVHIILYIYVYASVNSR